MRKITLFLIAMAFFTPLYAVEPDEVLENPVLENRARELSTEIRCMVCQNQSIDDSDAPLAKDLRVLVRERLKEGDTNEEVLTFLVARYGEFVLLKPRFTASNAVLWIAPIGVLLIGGGIAIYSFRRRKGQSQPEKPLSEAEHAALKKILSDPS
ncbi:MAG: cytochrome c-type biogenesis protein [Hyphomicrobiales bacterium]